VAAINSIAVASTADCSIATRSYETRSGRGRIRSFGHVTRQSYRGLLRAQEISGDYPIIRQEFSRSASSRRTAFASLLTGQICRCRQSTISTKLQSAQSPDEFFLQSDRRKAEARLLPRLIWTTAIKKRDSLPPATFISSNPTPRGSSPRMAA
jgi:hypothetical protein